MKAKMSIRGSHGPEVLVRYKCQDNFLRVIWNNFQLWFKHQRAVELHLAARAAVPNIIMPMYKATCTENFGYHSLLRQEESQKSDRITSDILIINDKLSQEPDK
jgi:hypothetical protein